MKKINVIDWRFHLGEEETAWQKDFDDTSWQAVEVPHDWSAEQKFTKKASSGTGYLPGGIGWYRTHVNLSSQQASATVRLIFEGVYKNAHVWVNGYHVGSRPSGYAEFSYDITELLQYAPDMDLVIAVRCDHTDIADSRWYNGSGITRPVRLEFHENIQLTEYGTSFETMALRGSQAEIRITHEVSNVSDKKRSVKIIDTLSYGQKGEQAAMDKQIMLPAGCSEKITFEKTIENARLWSDETPSLYCLATQLIDLEEADSENYYEELVGVRMTHFDPDQGFFINGINKKLHGVCLHEDAGCFGTAVPAAVWMRRLLKLKEAGTNAIRMTHNPHSQTLYQLCDLLGFYVFDEAFDEWENPKNKWWQGHNVYPPKYEGYAEFFPNWHKTDLENMIDAHKNHPCVIAWSIGNEIDYPNDPYANQIFSEMTGNNDASKPEAERIYNSQRPDTRRLTRIARQLTDIARKKDLHRPVTLAAAFPELSGKTGLFDSLEVIGYNYKEFLYQKDHLRFPKQSLLGSENGHGYREWLAVKENKFISGQFLWTGIDYLGEACGWPIHGSAAGILTMAGFAKGRFYLRKSWWTKTPMLHLEARIKTGDPYAATSRQWHYKKGQVVEIFAFSNCDNVELLHGGKQYQMSYDTAIGCFKAELPAFEEKLQAVGYRNEQEVSDYLVPALGACEMDVRQWKVPEEFAQYHNMVKSENLAQIEVTLRDRNGNKSLDEKLIRVKVTNGKLKGMENGDLSDITLYSDSCRRTYQGKLVVFIEKRKGSLLHLESENLPSNDFVID